MILSRKATRGMAWKSGLVILGAGAVLVYLLGSDLGAQSPREGDQRTVQGTVRSLTTAPKGEVDGAELSDGTVLHWPPHLEDRFSAVVIKGDRVRATGRMETGPRGDTHFEVRMVTNLSTGKAARNDDVPPPPPERRGPRPRGPRGRESRRDRATRTMTGTVREFTTAPKGEVDGLVLNDDTVIHWPPHREGRFKDIAAKGDRVRVTGWMETGPRGDRHLEAQTLTNLRTNKTARNEDAGPRPTGQRAGSREERLRDLEERLDRLLEEVRRLRKER